MKLLLNNYKLRFQAIWMFVAVIFGSALLASCEKDNLDIQQNFPFDVSVMPVPAAIDSSQTVEIRLIIQRTGDFSDAKYYIRYFQFDGAGTLRYYNEPAYLPNDLYPLPQTQFRLYYTSQSTVTQSFDIWVSDNFGNEKQLSFQFNSSD
jgi:hypothetical protein